jgi:hypothetical protein
VFIRPRGLSDAAEQLARGLLPSPGCPILSAGVEQGFQARVAGAVDGKLRTPGPRPVKPSKNVTVAPLVETFEM